MVADANWRWVPIWWRMPIGGGCQFGGGCQLAAALSSYGTCHERRVTLIYSMRKSKIPVMSIQCNDCQKNFTRQDTLRRHLNKKRCPGSPRNKRETNQKSLRNKTRSVITTQIGKTYTLIRSDTQSWECPRCKKAMSRADAVKRHLDTSCEKVQIPEYRPS